MRGLGSFLRKIREEKKLTLTNVCEKTGITDSRLSRIENESLKTSPPIDDVISLAKLYGIDFNEILSLSTTHNDKDFKEHRIPLRNLELLDKKELQHIQNEIDFIVGQKGTGKNEL